MSQNEEPLNKKGLPKQQKKAFGKSEGAPEGASCSECGIVTLIRCLSERSAWASVPRVSPWQGRGWTRPWVPWLIWRIQGNISRWVNLTWCWSTPRERQSDSEFLSWMGFVSGREGSQLSIPSVHSRADLCPTP